MSATLPPYPGPQGEEPKPHVPAGDEPVVSFTYRELWQQLLRELHEIKSMVTNHYQALDARVTRLESAPVHGKDIENLEKRMTTVEKLLERVTVGKLSAKDVYAFIGFGVGLAGLAAALVR